MSKCPPVPEAMLSKAIIAHANDALNKQANSIIDQAGLAQPTDLSSGSPFLDFPFDLGVINTAGTAGIPANFSGAKVLYRREGSTPGGRLTFQSGGRVFRIYPGCSFDAPVTGGVLTLATNSVTAGTALFTVIKLKGYDFMEPPFGVAPPTLGSSITGGVPVGPSGAGTQAYNSAAGNIPIADTDGVSLAGVTGARAFVESNGGSVIQAGTLRWWQWDGSATTGSRWAPTQFQDVVDIGFTAGTWCPSDKQIWVPEGRIYAEFQLGTNLAGSGAFVIRMMTYGNT